jgi:hypothetical protein
MSAHLEFQWSEAVYVTAGEIAYKYKMAHSWKKYAGYFFIGLIVIGGLRAINQQDYSVLYIGTILSLYWFYIKGFLYKGRLKNSFKKEGIHQLKMVFDITKGGININGNMIPWKQISLVILHPKGFLLERPEGYPYLPATAFSGDKDVKFFFALIEKHDIPLVRIT